MKKQKLTSQSEQHHDFSIFSISTTLADYLLAFRLNNLLKIKLDRQTDLPVYLSADNPVLFSLFYFEDGEQSEYHLIQDMTGKDQFINSFLLVLNGHFSEARLDEIQDLISGISDIFNINPVKPEKNTGRKSSQSKTIHFINTILTDLEYHKLEIDKTEDEKRVKLKPAHSRAVRKLYN